MQVKNLLYLIESNTSKYQNTVKLILKLKKDNIRFSDLTIEHSYNLLKNYSGKLGNQYYIILEELFYASLDLQYFRLAKFGETAKIIRLQGLLNECNDKVKESLMLYGEQVQKNKLDSNAIKRKITLYRECDRPQKAVQILNDFLQTNPCDFEAWIELADIYLENQEFKKAKHCYEEVILLKPGNVSFLQRYSEVLYTIGGSENFNTAMKYLCLIVKEHHYDLRANLVLLATLRNIKGQGNIKTLLQLVRKNIRSIYRAKNQQKLLKKLPFSRKRRSNQS